MRFALTCIVVFILATMLLMGEAAWLILVCVLVCRGAVRLPHLALRFAVVVLGAAILIAHFAGYKLYGSATIHDNRPILDSPHEFAFLAAPNSVLTTDGSRFEVRGVTFSPELLALPLEYQQLLFSRQPGPILIQADDASPSGVVFQWRCHYWCGNTFFPTFTPRRLPAYSRIDLGRFLTGTKLAVAQPPK